MNIFKNIVNNKLLKTVFFFFFFTLAFYCVSLGAAALLDPDEPVYAQTAREMVESGSWLTPRLNGLLWFDKPPLYFWFAAVSFKLFSAGEFASRFPSCLMAALLVSLIYLWAFRAFNEKIAFYSAANLATSLLFIFISRAAVTDMTLCFFMNLSFYMIYLAFCEPENRFKYINLFYFVSGFSVLTKGPVGIILPLMVIILFLLCRRDWKFLRALYSPSGFALFALSALPWYAAMLYLHGMQFFNTFIGYHNLIRFLEPEHVRTSSLFFYIPVLLAGFFPHLSVTGAVIEDFVKKIFSRDFYFKYIFSGKISSGGENYEQAPAFLIFVSAVIFIFFSIARTKLVTYILPMFPAFAIITGYYYEKLSLSGRKNYSGAALSLIIGGSLAYGFYAVAPVKIAIADPGPFFYLSIAAAAITIVNLAYSLFSRRRHFIFLNMFIMAVFVFTLNTAVLPQLGGLYSSKAVCALIKKEMKPGEKLGYFSKTPSALFYSDVPVEHVNESASSRMGSGSARGAFSSPPSIHGRGEVDFVRNISPVTLDNAYKYIDKFRKLKNFMSSKEKVYVIILNSDFDRYSQNFGFNFKRGGIAGKYTYIMNKK